MLSPLQCFPDVCCAKTYVPITNLIHAIGEVSKATGSALVIDCDLAVEMDFYLVLGSLSAVNALRRSFGFIERHD